jgi:hypothetical protein
MSIYVADTKPTQLPGGLSLDFSGVRSLEQLLPEAVS